MEYEEDRVVGQGQVYVVEPTTREPTNAPLKLVLATMKHVSVRT